MKSGCYPWFKDLTAFLLTVRPHLTIMLKSECLFSLVWKIVVHCLQAIDKLQSIGKLEFAQNTMSILEHGGMSALLQCWQNIAAFLLNIEYI